jgi:hypothetical protein
MKRNIGNIDKTVRALIVVLIGALYLTNVISGTTAIILGVVAGILLLTSLIGVCPLYLPFGINTTKKSSQT